MIGRDPECDLPLRTSACHGAICRSELADGAPLLTDLGSSNGTYVDGGAIDTEPLALVTREAIMQIGEHARARARDRPRALQPAGPFRRAPVRRRPRADRARSRQRHRARRAERLVASRRGSPRFAAHRRRSRLPQRRAARQPAAPGLGRAALPACPPGSGRSACAAKTAS